METEKCTIKESNIQRYSRQLIMPEIGVAGQQKLLNSSVLVVGAGGLGCPIIQYLVGAGVGRIGVVDYDVVETSNLQRQVIHTEQGAKDMITKVKSAANFAKSLNWNVVVDEHNVQFDRSNAADIVQPYDVVMDATDNVATRYLVNDVSVLLGKPLVSGSALRWEGQVTTHAYKPCDKEYASPCYRCRYPQPPPPQTVSSCSTGGVLGVVPGIIGCLQALEAIKIIIGMKSDELLYERFLNFDCLNNNFRNFKTAGRKGNCVVCGDHPTITLDNLPDYEKFCGGGAHDKCPTLHILKDEERMSGKEYKKYCEDGKKHFLLDVRQKVEQEICRLKSSVNLPIGKLESLEYFCKTQNKSVRAYEDLPCKLNAEVAQLLSKIREASGEVSKDSSFDIVVVCRRGNDSQRAVKILKSCVEFGFPAKIRDVKGGLSAMNTQLNEDLPLY